MATKYLRRRAVEEMTGLSCTSIYRMMNDGRFPRPVKITGRIVAWPEGVIADWLASRPVAHEGTPPQPRTLYLCEDPGLIPTIHKTAIDATKAALSYGPGATVSEWREVLS